MLCVRKYNWQFGSYDGMRSCFVLPANPLINLMHTTVKKRKEKKKKKIKNGRQLYPKTTCNAYNSNKIKIAAITPKKKRERKSNRLTVLMPYIIGATGQPKSILHCPQLSDCLMNLFSVSIFRNLDIYIYIHVAHVLRETGKTPS